MQGYFGQRKRENPEWSPNTGLVRTSEAKKPRVESEYRAISDKGSKNREWSPNAGLVRTKEAGKPKKRVRMQARFQKGLTKPALKRSWFSFAKKRS